MSAPRYTKEVKELLRTLEADGWIMLGRGRGNHYKLRHPKTSSPLIVSATSSDRSFQKAVLRQASRLLNA